LTTFSNSDDVEHWLTARRRPAAIILAARIGLRVIPLLPRPSRGEDTVSILRAFRCAQAAWAVVSYPGPMELRLAAQYVGSGVHDPAKPKAHASIQWASAAAGAFKEEDALRFAGHVAKYAISAAADATPGADIDILNSCAADAELLEQDYDPVTLALSSSLWRQTPDWAFQGWAKLERLLLDANEGWEVWTDWYEARLKGGPADRVTEVARATMPKETWDRGAGTVNAQIQSWYDERDIWRHATQVDDPQPPEPRQDIEKGDAATHTPSIPAQRPAAIEPLWRAGKLSLPTTAAETSLKGQAFGAALKSLRVALETFANDIAGEANIDRRFLSYVQKLVDDFPQRVPRQAALFQLGHAGEVFAAYAATVDAEWPPLLASRFHAIVLHYERTMRQSPVWRDFKRNATQQSLTMQQTHEAASLAVAVAAALRDPEAATFADPAIPEALEDLAEALRASDNIPTANVEASKEALAFDMVESVNNVLKRVGEEALIHAGTAAKGAGTTLTKAGVEYVGGVGKGVLKAAKRQGPKDGEALFKWLRRAVIAGGGVAIGSAAGLPHLLSAFPQAFAWLERLVGLIH
jgi:hypothetical protein